MDLQELLNKARQLKLSGERLEALKLYDQVFNVLTSEASAHARAQTGAVVDKGEARHIMPKYFEETQKYLRRDKVAATISNNMAVIFAELGDNKSAKKFFEQSIELTPVGVDYPDPRIGLEELNK